MSLLPSVSEGIINDYPDFICIMSQSITADLFASFNILVLERLDFGLFKIAGTKPDWLNRVCRQRVTSRMEIFLPQEEFSFLDNFLIDAEEFWRMNGGKPLKSGSWCQSNFSEREECFEASAICTESKKILLIKILNELDQENQSLIQKARENSLNTHIIQKDNKEKEVLLQLMLHDIAGQLNGINYCFALLEFENLTSEGKERIEIGKMQTLRQEMLIRQIMDAFSDEVHFRESFAVDPDKAPDILISIQESIQLFTPTSTLKKVQFQLAPTIDMIADWKVVGEKSPLDRVIVNLIENALHYSPPESTVTIDLQEDEESILVTVDDRGSGVSPEIAQTLFQKFCKGKLGRTGLGLYFCRITIERWGGTIGYFSPPEGGSRFWFRLPKPSKK